MEYFVAANGNDRNPGTADAPFRTIQKAAHTAYAGDTVTVRGGVYRECVIPPHSGEGNDRRITFRAYAGEKVILKGSEPITGWEECDGIMSARIPNSIFNGENPFDTEIDGDWLQKSSTPFLHTGMLFINEKPLREQLDKQAVYSEELTYHAEVGNEYTVISANFGDILPNDALAEITVRKSCFMPAANGINYITVSGFEMTQCATQWAPPTAEQTGIIWARMCKGWIIENNRVSHSRCSGISLGIDSSFGQNAAAVNHRKPGFRTQLEIVFKALRAGFSKELIGSHIVRNNQISDCGQAGIVGHLGGAFSEIYGNHIYNIGLCGGFTGAELGGIKLHAAIDAYIHHNAIHNCQRGMWLDWQAQGVRVSSNVFYNNGPRDDLYIEVSHGPALIDNNIFNSELCLSLGSQGNAFVHNWFGGRIEFRHQLYVRYTPYHLPHSTEIKGISVVYGADDRFYQNVFTKTGTDLYNGCPESEEEYIKEAAGAATPNNYEVMVYYTFKQPAYVDRNIYSSEAGAFEKEKHYEILKSTPHALLSEDEDGIYAVFELEDTSVHGEIINSRSIPMPRISDERYEDADGNDILLDTDITGVKRNAVSNCGPSEILRKKVCVFKFPTN